MRVIASTSAAVLGRSTTALTAGGGGTATSVEFIMRGFSRDPVPASPTGFSTMVVIRLARGGAKKRPFFNIVVADSRLRRDGRFIERVGFYNPVASGGEQPLRVAFDRVEHWTGHGAQMSPTVRRLVEQAKTAPVAAPEAA